MHAMCNDGIEIQMHCLTSACHSFVPGTPKSFLLALNMMYHRLSSTICHSTVQDSQPCYLFLPLTVFWDLVSDFL